MALKCGDRAKEFLNKSWVVQNTPLKRYGVAITNASNFFPQNNARFPIKRYFGLKCLGTSIFVHLSLMAIKKNITKQT